MSPDTLFADLAATADDPFHDHVRVTLVDPASMALDQGFARRATKLITPPSATIVVTAAIILSASSVKQPVSCLIRLDA